MLSFNNHPYFEALSGFSPPTAEVWGGTVCSDSPAVRIAAPLALTDVQKGSTTSGLMEALLCFSGQPLRGAGCTTACKALDVAGAFGHKCVLTPSLPNSSWLGSPSPVQPLAVLHSTPPNYPVPPSMENANHSHPHHTGTAMVLNYPALLGASYTYLNRQGETGEEEFGYLPMAPPYIKSRMGVTSQKGEILMLYVLKQHWQVQLNQRHKN